MSNNVEQFKSRAQLEEEAAQKAAELSEHVEKHSGFYLPFAASPGSPVTMYRGKGVDFSLGRPTVQVLIDSRCIHAREDVIAQLRRVIEWVESNDLASVDPFADDLPSMYVEGYR
jgi:hypothetical protein